jgi:hypothetical protein
MDPNESMAKEFLAQLVDESSIEPFEAEQSWTYARPDLDTADDDKIRKMAVEFLTELAKSGLIEPPPIRVTVADGNRRSVRVVRE